MVFKEPFAPGSLSHSLLARRGRERERGALDPCAVAPANGGGGPRVLGRAARLKADRRDELDRQLRKVAKENDYPERWITWLVGR